MDISQRRKDRFQDCGRYPWVAKRLDESEQFVIVSNRCRDRFCPSCARIKASTIAENLERHVKARTLRFITFTLVSTTLPLSLMLTKLYDSFRKLRANKVWKNTQEGGASFLEVKIGKGSGRWHPHLHVLCEGKFVRVQELRRVWERITGGSHQVWVELVRDKRAMLRYVTKYVSKPFDMNAIRNDDQLDELLVSLTGTHSALTFGSWRGLKLCAAIRDHDFEYVCSIAQLKKDIANQDATAIGIWNALALHYGRNDQLLDVPTRAPPKSQPKPVADLKLFEIAPNHWLDD